MEVYQDKAEENNVNHIIEDISNFIFVENVPEKADAIMVVGGGFPELPETAAQLWKDNYAPFILIGGGIGAGLKKFQGPRTKKEIYNKEYLTECDFYTDVLLKNGIPEDVILGEKKSAFTRENAVYAKKLSVDAGLELKKVLLICKAFHARRCLMFYQSYFPGVEFLVIPCNAYNIGKNNWYLSEGGISRVLGEIKRCGEQFSAEDINNYL